MRTVDVRTQNADFQRFVVLKTNRRKRYGYGEFLAEGVRNINEAIRCGWQIAGFLHGPEDTLSDWARGLLPIASAANYRLSPGLMAQVSGKADTSEILALVRMRPDDELPPPSNENPLYALFDRPSNRGNLGAVMRSCDALGVERLLITGHAVDPYDPEVITATMGSFFRQPFTRVTDMPAFERWLGGLRETRGLTVIGTSAHAARPVYDCDLTGPLLVMLGNETDGLSARLAGLCDSMAAIPMARGASASSLNVACAATAVFCEVSRQRAAI